MKKSLLILFILTLLAGFTSSCDGKKEEIDNLQQEVMAIHDEVMPKMQNLMQLNKELETLKKNTDSAENMDKFIEIQELQSEITAADKSMMQWMRAYDAQLNDKTKAEKLEYLGKEKIKIQQVKQQMLSVISRSQTFIAENKSSQTEE